MKRYVNYDSHTVEYQIPEVMIKYTAESLKKCFVLKEVVADCAMSREVANDSHSFNLNLFVLGRKKERLASVEKIFAGDVREETVALCIVEEHVSRTTNRVKNELFILTQLSCFDCNFQAMEKIVQQLSF